MSKLAEKKLRERLQRFESTRHLMWWADHSTVAGHTYLVYTVSCLYDPAIFYTAEELNEKQGLHIDVEEVVTKPHIHIIAQCSSKDEDQ